MTHSLPKLSTTTLIFTLLASLFLSLALPIFAQSSSADAVGLMAIPPRIGEDGKLVVKPGSTIQLETRVRNISSRAVSVRSLTEDFIIGDDGLTPIPVEELTSSRWSLAQWIQIPISLQTIEPGESATIPFVVQVPEDAVPGGRYAMVMHQIDGATAEVTARQTGGQTAINQRVGTLVYLRVDGAVTEDANIRNMVVPGVLEFGPVPISFEVENLSDIHIRPAPIVTITNWFGKEVESYAVESQNIFPFSQRKFDTQWEHLWGFGRYTAKVSASYGESGKVAIETAQFWMIPYTFIGGGLLILLALLGVSVALRRYLHHRSDVTHKHIELLEEKIKHLESNLPDQS